MVTKFVNPDKCLEFREQAYCWRIIPHPGLAAQCTAYLSNIGGSIQRPGVPELSTLKTPAATANSQPSNYPHCQVRYNVEKEKGLH